MAVYAVLDDSGTVTNMIVADQDFITAAGLTAVEVPDGPGGPGVGWTTLDGGRTWQPPATGQPTPTVQVVAQDGSVI